MSHAIHLAIAFIIYLALIAICGFFGAKRTQKVSHDGRMPGIGCAASLAASLTHETYGNTP
jgi:hypothetical protein